MSVPNVSLRRADESDLRYVETLLAENGLPTGDVRSKSGCFYVAHLDGDPVGIGGIERCGSDGVLRSVVVESSVRGTGIGTAICAALERTARSEGIERLSLLTTTASGFFADLGYAEIDRADAPEAIRRTAEFDDRCPASATCMTKSL